MHAPWLVSPEGILEHFQVDASRGLTAHQAAKHAEIYGTNGTLYISLRHLKSSFYHHPSLSRTPHRAANSIVGAGVGTIQGSTRLDLAGFRFGVFCPGVV
jgi:hypothetical protein